MTMVQVGQRGSPYTRQLFGNLVAATLETSKELQSHEFDYDNEILLKFQVLMQQSCQKVQKVA